MKPIKITRLNILFFGLFIVLSLLACSSNDTSSEDKKFFRYNQDSALNSLDPAFSKDQAGMWIANQLYNGLVQFDADLKVQPCLAKSWSTSEDGLTITFELNYPIYFQADPVFNTKEERLLTAQDVVYSFNRIVDPAVASPGAWIFNGRVAEKNPFVAVDDHTFTLQLTKPFQPIMGILAMQYCSVVSRKAGEKYGADLRSHPVGTGPFALKNWRENDVLVLEKNPDYWEKDISGKTLPYLDFVRVTFSENMKNAWLSLLDGKVDLVSGIDETYRDAALDEEGSLRAELKDKIQLIKSPYLNTEYLGFNLNNGDHPILKDKRLRQAMNFAIDRKKMIRYLRSNVGLPANAGFIPSGLPAFDPTNVAGYDYNPKKASALLSEAGFPNGQGLSPIKLETTAGYKDLCTFIQNQLGDIGIKVEMELSPPAYLREKMSKGESSFFRGSWLADYPDGENYLTVFYGGNPAPPNYTRFKNAEFDKLYEESLAEPSPEKRISLYQKMDRMLIEEAPVIPLFYDEVMRFVNKRVTGLGSNGINMLHLKRVDVE